MYHVRRFAIVLVVFLCLSFMAWFLPGYLDPTPPDKHKQMQDKRWVSGSPYWLDRQACRWLSLCGIHHLSWDPAALLPWNQNNTDSGELGGFETLELRSLSGGEDPDDRHPGWQTAGQSKRGSRSRGRGRKSHRDDKGERRRILKEIPDYVLDYAPLVHLYSGENFWPSDIAEHVRHMTPYLEQDALNQSALLDKLHKLNKEEGRVFLTSDDDVESRPEWLHSHTAIPNPWDDDGSDDDNDAARRRFGSGSAEDDKHLKGTTWWDASRKHPVHRFSDPRRLEQADAAAADDDDRLVRRGDDQHPMPADPNPPTHKPDGEGYSKSPAVLILVDKGDGIVDAFWFFFYSYNLGQTVLNIRFGNHVGDWEHCMIRFERGAPRGIFFSEHEGGQAYTYEAVEKRAGRPVIYSAVGSHAMYAQPGNHPYVLPFQMLKDVTDRGPLWDPAKNAYSYWYDYEVDLDDGLDLDDDLDGEIEALLEHSHVNTSSLAPTTANPDAPTSWFHYAGPWGDQVYSLADLRQWRLFKQYHYVTGPLGPKFKRLSRQKLCITNRCRILDSLKPGQTWYG